jgi:hypothetical protein
MEKQMVLPTITLLTPNFGTNAGGTTVAVTGTGFVAPVSVSFNGIPATSVVVNSATSVTVVTPAFPGAAPSFLSLTASGGTVLNDFQNTFYFLDVDTVPDGRFSSTNYFFDPASDYVVFGRWNFASGHIYLSPPPNIVGGSANEAFVPASATVEFLVYDFSDNQIKTYAGH